MQSTLSFHKTWVFDLDNTLHNALPHIFPHINRAMTAYLQRHLELDKTGADQLRIDYWHRYGATLVGLMRHHGTNPLHFLWETHQFPDLARMLVCEPGLKATLKRLPGRKVIFSNAPIHYSRAVLEALEIAAEFDQVFTIEHTGFRPKPDAEGFYRLFRRHGIDPQHAVMVEDSLENLQTAKRLGMKTVWLNRAVKRPAYVDVCISTLQRLPRLAFKL